MSSTGTSPVITSKNIEDILTWLVPIAVSLAGFNWSGILPGVNGFFAALAFGFLAKFLVGIQQNGWSSWEDLVPTVILALAFITEALSANPNYLYYGTVIGFVVKALGYFSDKTHPIEDIFLALGAFLVLYGTARGDAIGSTLASVGALIALIGKSIPSIAIPGTPTPAPTPVPAPTPAAGTP